MLDTTDYFYKLISEGMVCFIENRVLCFKEAQHVPVHFVGAIAHFSKEIIEDTMKSCNIVRHPIDGLVEYYRKQVLPNL